MNTLLDYVSLRQDISFSYRALNPIDLLVFSELAYVNWKDVVMKEPRNLQEACQRHIELHKQEDQSREYVFSLQIPLLIEAVAQSRRYEEVKIQDYETVFSEEKDIQFAAMTFVLPNGVRVFTFRGTDGSICGWRENFQMTYEDELPCRHLAREYVEKRLEEIPETKSWFGLKKKKEVPPFYLTGHSKGGNLAMYAAYTIQEHFEALIQAVNFDGPGFLSEFYEKQDLTSRYPKVITYAPQGSIIGRMLIHKEEKKIMEASQFGMFQHDAFTWHVGCDDFFYVSKFDEESNGTMKIVDPMFLAKTKEERMEFRQTLFSLLEEMQINTVADFTTLSLRKGFSGLMSLRKLNSEERKFLFELFEFIKTQTVPVIKKRINKE